MFHTLFTCRAWSHPWHMGLFSTRAIWHDVIILTFKMFICSVCVLIFTWGACDFMLLFVPMCKSHTIDLFSHDCDVEWLFSFSPIWTHTWFTWCHMCLACMSAYVNCTFICFPHVIAYIIQAITWKSLRAHVNSTATARCSFVSGANSQTGSFFRLVPLCFHSLISSGIGCDVHWVN